MAGESGQEIVPARERHDLRNMLSESGFGSTPAGKCEDPIMLQHSPPRGSLAPGNQGAAPEFVSNAKTFPLKFIVLCNLGCYTEERLTVRMSHLHPSLSPPWSWRWEGSRGGAAMYDTGAMGSVAIKPETCVFPKIGKIGRKDDSGFRSIVPVLREVQRRGALIEEPVAHFTTEQGSSFFATKLRPGTALEDFLEVAEENDRRRAALLAGTHLADLHRKGIAHGHPHFDNWLIDRGEPLLIDGKACTFAPDYPHTYQTGRTVSFAQACENDRNIVLSNFEEAALKNEFAHGYEKVI